MSGSAWITLALSVLLLVAAGGVLLRAWKRPLPRSRRSRPRPIPRHPVVFAHGLFGFDSLDFAGRRIDYFRDVPKKLREIGIEVHVARVSPIADVATRAEELARQIDAIPSRRVNLIAHSMGGIDARYAISRLGLKKVASLTTIGTPHHGTPLAHLGSALGPIGATGEAFARLSTLRVPGSLVAGYRRQFAGIDDATPQKMKRLNERLEDDRNVHYGCCLAQVGNGVRGVHTLLVPSYLFLHGAGGANDGVVPTASQRWGDVLADIDADHWAQIGWSKKFDAPSLYVRILSELRARGF